MILELKQCSKCDEFKLPSEFHKDKIQKSGYYPSCKKCRTESSKEFYQSDRSLKWKDYAKRPDIRAKNIERSKQYRKNGKKTISARKYYVSDKGRSNWLKCTYGITLEQYTEMLLMQKGVCAICGLPETASDGKGELKRLSIDHDHATNVIRGLLCMKCNMMLGSAVDNPETLISGAKYLEEHK